METFLENIIKYSFNAANSIRSLSLIWLYDRLFCQWILYITQVYYITVVRLNFITQNRIYTKIRRLHVQQCPTLANYYSICKSTILKIYRYWHSKCHYSINTTITINVIQLFNLSILKNFKKRSISQYSLILCNN